LIRFSRTGQSSSARSGFHTSPKTLFRFPRAARTTGQAEVAVDVVVVHVADPVIEPLFELCVREGDRVVVCESLRCHPGLFDGGFADYGSGSRP
jgi:hypothetical protein